MSNDKPENDSTNQSDPAAQRERRLARLDILSASLKAATTPDPAQRVITTPVMGLEAALRENELRKIEAKKYGDAMAPELDKQIVLQAKLDALPQRERRQVLDAMGLKHVSAAPPPITPLRGAGVAPSRQPLPANWNKWKFIPKCELWKAVCLTLDIEPDSEKHDIRGWLQSRRGFPYGFPTDFPDRLQVAQANVSTNGPIHPQSLYRGVLNNPHADVLLSDVATFAIRCEWTIPEPMRALARPAEAVVTPEPTETKEQRQDRRLAACDAAGLKMDKVALSRLPDGVGDVADSEGVTRQAFSTDVKAALNRREAAKRHPP